MNKNYRSAHFVGHSKLKELDIDDYYKRKQMNEEIEAEMTKIDYKGKKDKSIQRDNEPIYRTH